MRLSKLQEMEKDREAWRAAVHGSQRVGHMTERLNNNYYYYLWKHSLVERRSQFENLKNHRNSSVDHLKPD